MALLWANPLPLAPGQLLRIVLGSGVLSLLTLCVYRLFFHPYSKYPGPFLAKLTSWYSVYHTYRGDLHTDIWRCHEKYGDLVRYAPNRLLVNTEAGLKGIYGHGKNVRKSKSYLRISLVAGVHPTLSTIDDQKHAKLRRILNQGLSDSQIRTMDDELRHVALLFADGLGNAQDRFQESSVPAGDGWSVPKNMALWCDYFTFDVMSQLVFQTSYHMLTDAESHWVIDGVLGQMRRISFLHQLPELEDMRLDKLLFPDARRKAFRFSGKSRSIMEARKERMRQAEENEQTVQDNLGKTDLFSRLLNAKDPETGEGLSHKQLWAESNLLIIAGSDTASTAMAALFYYLTRSLAAYARVTKEVRSVFPSPDTVCQGPKLLSCTYLRACIQEAMRLCPSASGAMWREVNPGGLHIPAMDLYVPAGLEVATGIYSLNHSAVHYPEPFAFRPERWLLDEVGEEAVTKAKAAFATFSVGPRNCVGKGLAMIEISLAMATVLSQFDFKRVDGVLGEVGEGRGEFKGQYHTMWAFTSLKDGPFVQFRSIDAKHNGAP